MLGIIAHIDSTKSGKIFIKVNPKHTSQKCHACNHVDASSRDKEKFICVACGHIDHADINAAKNIKGLAVSNIASIVCGDSAKLESQGSKRPKYCKEISARSMSKRVEPRVP